ncbi:MAG TPA: phosphotransferase family protein [Amycolatopsis sp.]|nr:phosphotransferase family protein [Amycolatopsis sp.]
MPDETLKLPEDIVAWLEEAAGLPLVAADRIPGGGMRQGWFVDFAEPGGARRELFLRYSPKPESAAFHRLGDEAQVVRALGEAGARVAKVHAVHPVREAVLQERIEGGTWFSRIGDPDEQLRVARDFVRQLAYVHRLDPARLRIPALGPARSAREHALDRIQAIRDRARRADGTLDPLVRLSADWLERNVPDYDGPVVLVQGDTGPGNFLYLDGRVSAVVDWELAHWGDPMDDIAWLSLRTVQDTFTHLPDRIAEYVELSGHKLDVDRVWYYRVFAETTMATMRTGGSGEPEPPHDAGNRILYTQLHRRLWLEALDVVMGLGLSRPAEPEPATPEPWHYLYDNVLDMLRTITPRIDDPLAQQWTKGAARVVRYLRDADSSGRATGARELDRLAAELGTRPESLAAGREALRHAAGSIPEDRLVRLLWDQIMSNDYLMRSASGALGRRTWPPLT